MNSVVIIGGGLMGSAAAWHLLKEGWSVQLIEQQPEQYHHGSSLGTARIARSLGLPNNIWSFMHDQTVQEIKQLISFLQQEDSSTHQMSDIYTTSPVNYVFFDSTTKLGGLQGVLEQRDAGCRYAFNNQQATHEFGLTLPNDAVAIVREERNFSGTLNPHALITKLHRAIVLKGGTIHYNTRVRNLSCQASNYHLLLETAAATNVIDSHYLLSAAGPYTAGLLHQLIPDIAAYIQPKRVFVALFTFDPNVFAAWTKTQIKALFKLYPAIYFNKELSFAMVEHVNAAGIPMIKIGGHFCRSNYECVDTVWSQALSVSEIEWAKQETIAHLNTANLSAKGLYYDRGYSCVYSLTKDEIPIVSRLPKDKQDVLPGFVLMGGMSGVGAKGCMAYGRLAAASMTNKKMDAHPDLTKMESFFKWRSNPIL